MIGGLLMEEIRIVTPESSGLWGGMTDRGALRDQYLAA